jgi:hypothetical protein
MPMRFPTRSVALLLAAGLVVAAVAARRGSTALPDPGVKSPPQSAQNTSSASPDAAAGSMPGMPGMDGASAADGAMAHESMAMGLHMKMTTPRPRRAGDEQRAAAILDTLRGATVRYRDYRLAVADGFIQFLPKVRQPMYHFTNYRYSWEASWRFDPAHPTSLLYKPTPDGFELVGAMYTAPRRFDEDQLDARVPLSVAAWHQHVNLCLPRIFGYATADWKKFGLNGSIATEAECQKNGGVFHPVVLGWMVHAYPFEQNPAKIWAQ